MTKAHYVPSIGIVRGIAVWWRKEVCVKILYHDKNIIDCKVIDEEGHNMHMTWVYGDPKFNNRIKNWNILRSVGRGRRGPWICVSVFNDISSQHEKSGGRVKNQ